MRLGLVCADNMNDLDAARFQMIGNQRAMTTPPNRFRAHNRRRPHFARKIDKTVDAFLKFSRFHVIGITAKRCISPRRIARVGAAFSSPTQFRKMFVTNSVLA